MSSRSSSGRWGLGPSTEVDWLSAPAVSRTGSSTGAGVTGFGADGIGVDGIGA